MKTAAIFASGLALAASAIATPTTDIKKRSLSAVTISGNAFFAGSDRFFVRGIDYQPGGASDPVDPIANTATCKRDITYFKQLGINTVRVYTVDNTANHDECMSMLSDAGIYLALDVNNGKYSINRADPSPSYNAVYLQSVFATIDAFQKYDNTLLFFSGNEVVNAATNTNCAPYIKAVTRDMKSYISARGYRAIPVGYSAADVSENRYQMAAYMNCGGAEARSDFFSFNDYSWCDPNTFEGSGWAAEVALYANYSIPLFLSEYGCNKNPPREFEEVQALYNEEMTAVYSGGLVYEYSEESDNPNFGLVNIDGNSVTLRSDFNTLQKQLAANPAPTGSAGYKTNLQPLECPAYSNMWEVKGDALPVMPSAAESYMKSGAGKGPGLAGAGSQNSGSASQSSATPSGAMTATNTGSPSTSTGAAASLRAPELHLGPLVCGLFVVVSTVLGASLL